MSRRELCSLADSTPVVASRQPSSRSTMEGESLKDKVVRLKALLKEAQVAVAEKDRQLAGEKKAFEKHLEVTLTRQHDEQVAAVKMECELHKLQDVEALQQNFDKERQRVVVPG